VVFKRWSLSKDLQVHQDLTISIFCFHCLQLLIISQLSKIHGKWEWDGNRNRNNQHKMSDEGYKVVEGHAVTSVNTLADTTVTISDTSGSSASAEPS